jgi:hypothetical protein
VAPRRPFRAWNACARGAGLTVCLWLALASGVAAQHAISASYDDPTTRYPHGALGDDVEHATLTVRMSDGVRLRATRDRPVVFEDTEPRLVDLDGDRRSEILTVEAHESQGARLTVWRADGEGLRRAASTPWIGQRFRWLAPLGAADLDGDGAMEIAYVDRPHLARILRVWRVGTDATGAMTLREIASAPGLTNHRLHDPAIPGGIRTCDGPPEMITANADWTRVMATRLRIDGSLRSRALGAWRPGALADALACAF